MRDEISETEISENCWCGKIMRLCHPRLGKFYYFIIQTNDQYNYIADDLL